VQLIDTTASVVTPERVEFRFRVAGPAQRAAAWSLDLLIRMSVLVVLLVLASLFAFIPGISGVSTGVMLVAVFLLDWFYGVFFEGFFAGLTPGKRAMGLRVVRDDGSPVRWGDVLLRNLLRAVDFQPMFFGLGALVMLTDRRFRRLGDMVAGTVVVAEDRAMVLAAVPIEPPVSDEERQGLPAGVTLSNDELATLERFLRRRHALGRERSEELAWLFGPALSARTGIEAATWERVLVLAYARATGKDQPEEPL
jgi:uncharacterized RDD family membrane protein YckC